MIRSGLAYQAADDRHSTSLLIICHEQLYSIFKSNAVCKLIQHRQKRITER